MLVQFKGVLSEAPPIVASALVDLDGYVGVVIGASPQGYTHLRLFL